MRFTIIFGSLLILLGIALPPILNIYSPSRIPIWFGMLLLLIEYDKLYKHDKIIRFGKYGLITYITVWAFGIALYLLFPNGQNMLPDKLFYFLTHPVTLMLDMIFPIPLKQLPDGGYLVDQSYVRKCVSMISDILAYVGTGFLIGVAMIINKNTELTRR